MNIIKDIRSKLEVAVDEVGGTDLEKKVKKATSLENWPATNTQLHELSNLTNDYGAYREIMPLLWKRLGSPPREWRTVYKCLVLLNHLLRFGSARVVEESREHQFQIRQLLDFHFREKDSDKDLGSGVRERAGVICDLLRDGAQLEQVRREAAANVHKFVGVSNNGSVSSMSGSGGYGRYDDRGFGGGSGAFGDNSATGSYDAYVSKPAMKESSPYDDGEIVAEKKKKKSKHHAEDDADAPSDPYAESASVEKKKKKKKDAANESTDAAEEEESEEKKARKAKKALKIKMRDAPAAATAAPVIAAPPADDGFGEFTTASSSAAAPVAAAPQAAAAAAVSEPLSFDSIATSQPRAAPQPASSGDLLDMFAAASIDSAPSSSNWAAQGPIDFMSAAQTTPQQVAPTFAPAASSARPTNSAPFAAASVNQHNNEDAFASFVAGRKPTNTPAAIAAAPAAAAPATASKKSGELAWDNSLINLDGMSSVKPTPKLAPAPFIPMQNSADPFSHLHSAQQQPRMMMQQRPPMPMQMGGMGMNPMMNQQQQQQMQMQMGQMGHMQQMGGGMGMNPMMGGGGGMGFGGMGMGMGGGMGGMGGGFGTNGPAFPTQAKANTDIFF